MSAKGKNVVSLGKAAKNALTEPIKGFSVRDYVDTVISFAIGATPFVGGGISASSSTIAIKQVQKRMAQLEQLSPIIDDIKQHEDSFFAHRQIILKFVEDADILEEDLQKNIADYTVNCKNRKYYKDVLNFLITIPVSKINHSNLLSFNIRSKTDFNDRVVGITEKEKYITPFIELENLESGVPDMYGGSITLNEFTNDILYRCLKILNEETCPGIDNFIKEKGWG